MHATHPDGRHESSETVGTSDIVASLRRAFMGAPAALRGPQAGGDHPQTFALQNNAYYNLEVYLGVGLALPSSTERFKRTFPEAQLSILVKHDPHVYNVRRFTLNATHLSQKMVEQELETCFVDIHKHCRDFNNECFSQFITVSHSIVGYCETFERRVDHAGGLKEQFAVLTNEAADKSSIAYLTALSTAEVHASALSKEADELRAQCDELVKHLHSVSRFLFVPARLPSLTVGARTVSCRIESRHETCSGLAEEADRYWDREVLQ